MYHISDSLSLVHEHAGQVSWGGMQRPSDQVWTPAAIHQSLYGWPDGNNNYSAGEWMDSPGLADAHQMGSDKLQVKEIQVLKRGKVTDQFHFWHGSTKIPSVTERPIQSFRKTIASTLNGAMSIKATKQELELWLVTVERSGLPGKIKAWIYQHGILARILCHYWSMVSPCPLWRDSRRGSVITSAGSCACHKAWAAWFCMGTMTNWCSPEAV